MKHRADISLSAATPAKPGPRHDSAKSAAPIRTNPESARIMPERRLSQPNVKLRVRRRSAAIPNVRPIHHKAEPTKTPATSTLMPPSPAVYADLGEDRGQHENGDGVGDGDAKADAKAPKSASPASGSGASAAPCMKSARHPI